MFADTFKLIWTDILVTLMLGVILVIQLLSGERYADRIAEARKLSDEWKSKRMDLAASARRVARFVGFSLYVAGMLYFLIASLWTQQLRAWMNTPQQPILFTHVCLLVILVAHFGLYIGIINIDQR